MFSASAARCCTCGVPHVGDVPRPVACPAVSAAFCCTCGAGAPSPFLRRGRGCVLSILPYGKELFMRYIQGLPIDGITPALAGWKRDAEAMIALLKQVFGRDALSAAHAGGVRTSPWRTSANGCAPGRTIPADAFIVAWDGDSAPVGTVSQSEWRSARCRGCATASRLGICLLKRVLGPRHRHAHDGDGAGAWPADAGFLQLELDVDAENERAIRPVPSASAFEEYGRLTGTRRAATVSSSTKY